MIVTRLLADCFFFKQKTAYELRISDWSSDVCSSDLAANRRRVDGQPACGGDGRRTGGSGAVETGPAAVRPRTLRRGRQRRLRATAGQIGRASCRERVCPYV